MVRLRAVDFMRGLFCQLAVEGFTKVPFKNRRGFHTALIQASSWLRTNSSSYDVEPDFQFFNNDRGQSYAVRYALAELLQQDLLIHQGKGWDTLLFATHPDYARHIVSKLPGGEPLYKAAAGEFLKHYPLAIATKTGSKS